LGTYLRVDGDPNEVSGTGAILRSMGETLNNRAQGILGDINAVEAERPWGDDSYGQAFESTYNVTPEGSDGPLRQAVADGMSRAGEGLTRVGDATVLAMSEYQGTDVENRDDINRANI
jgi:hypothetical protein